MRGRFKISITKKIFSVITLTLFITITLMFSCSRDDTIGPPNIEESRYSLSGKVINSSGFAADSVTVNITGRNINETILTDFHGQYFLSGLPNGDYTVTPLKTEHVFSPQSRKVKISDIDKDIEEFIGVVVDENEYSVVGRIASAYNLPINRFTARIKEFDDSTNEIINSYVATVNTNGFFNFSKAVKNKRYLIYPEANSNYSFSPDSCYVTIQENVTVCNFTLSYSGPQLHTVSGRVIDEEGNGVIGHWVRFSMSGNYYIQTDSYGYYALQVEDEVYWISSGNENYGFYPERGISVVVDGEDIIIPDFTTYYVGPTYYKIFGSVLDSDGNAIPDVTIRFLKLGGTETDSDGTFESDEFDNLLVREKVGTTIVPVVPEKKSYSFTPDTTYVTMTWHKGVGVQNEEIVLPDFFGTKFPAEDYFTLESEKNWTFERTVDDGTPTEYTVGVEGTVTENDLTYTQLTSEYPAFYSKYRIHCDRVYALSDEGKDVIFLKFGIPENTEWLIGFIRSKQSHIGTYLGIETVDVLAGTFVDCLHFETRVKHGETSYESIDMWFARDIGLVKAERILVSIGEVIETVNDELKSYEIK
ncbi:MAG: carboxypeptidase regulatory-like domain-containing protein [Candidatus Latescibacteria bacterium]|jgi:hypothetical protein|nr:carboxypeptidase regulatory-like domain-containing protein [Candidatus Latescibacterota bacterium]